MKSFPRITNVLFFILFSTGEAFPQKPYDELIETSLKELSIQIDSLSAGRQERSSFLDRGIGDNYELYDVLENTFYHKLGVYLKLPRSLKKMKPVMRSWIQILEGGNKTIYQWEYLSGGTQEEVRKYVQIVYPDSIQVYDDSGYRTNKLYYLDGRYLEFESKKGCSTCCEERIIYKGEKIYEIKYRDTFINELFSFDKENNSIKIELKEIYSEDGGDADFRVLNEVLILHYNGTEFIKVEL